MKRTRLKSVSAIVSAIGLAVPAMLNGAEIDVAKTTEIYYAESSAAGAANELADYLTRIFGGKFKVTKVKEAQKTGFHIGKALAPKDIKTTHREQIFRLVTEDGRIHLWGAESNKKIPGDLRAVEDFLERECGVRWLWPGPLGEVVPKLKTLKLKPGFFTEQPAFPVRILKYGSEATWNRRMKLGQSMDYRVGHAFNSFIPPAKYFASHPEYFGLVSPENWVGSGDKPEKPARNPRQLCTTNPDVRRIIAEKVAARNSDAMQSISPNDGYGFCECENCRKQDRVQWKSIHAHPDLSDRMWNFTRDVAIQAKKLNPKSKVLLNAYSFYSNPPSSLEAMPDNVYVLRCLFGAAVKDRKAIEDEFARYTKAGIKIWVYEYWGTYNQGMPWNVIHMVDWECKLLKKNNGFGMRVENGTQFANCGLTNYVGAKLLWDPDLDVDAVIDDYCRAGFGPAAKEMRAYFDLVEKYTMKLFGMSAGGYTAMFTAIPQNFNEEFFKQADALFKKALAKKPLSAAEQARIMYVKSGLEYGRTIAAWSAILSQVNAHGGDLPLVFPAEEPAQLDDASLKALFKQADQICSRRHDQSLSGALRQDFSLTYNDRLARTLWHMPYQILVQHLMKGIDIGFFNYFVNNAFELRNPPEFKHPVYGWRIEGGAPEVTLSECHDDIHDITPMYHGRQGQSLCLTLKPGEKATLTNAVKVVQPAGTDMLVSGWFKGAAPSLEILWNIDGKTKVQKSPVAARGLKEKSGWQEITFTPFQVPAGKKVSFTVRFTFANTGKCAVKMFSDDLKLKKAR
ncbi:MAG: DUF4838 domain-containing protein [Lentisphaeria bacterium]|nr:DUF4838 domain-containing protein [Lentisphaeria bacterium]